MSVNSEGRVPFNENVLNGSVHDEMNKLYSNSGQTWGKTN